MTMTTAALLSSCGLYKSYERPADIQTDGLYRSDNTQSGDSLGLASFAWREIFTEPQLQTLIERGLAQNTNLRSAQLQIEQSEASLKAAKWAYIPSLAFAPQGSLAGVDWGKATQTYTIPVSASWQIDIFGSLHNAKKRAQAQLENSQAYKQAVQSQLIAAIANYYYSLAMLKDQLAVSQETEKLWKENVETTRALMNAGQSNMAAVSQTEANYYSICTQITDLKQQISDLENKFSALLGEAPQKYAIGSMNNWKVPTRMSAGIPAAALANRPDVKQAEDLVGSDAARWLGLSNNSKRAEIVKKLTSKPLPEVKVTQEMRQTAYDNWETTDDHGMQIYGIAKDQNGKEYYMVKNSWGDAGTYKGIWYASKAFVAYKTMNIVVNKNAIPEPIRKKLGLN